MTSLFPLDDVIGAKRCLADNAARDARLTAQSWPADGWLHLREGGVRPIRLRPIDFFPQAFKDIVRHFEENLDHLRVELAAGPELDFRAGGLKCLGGAVGTVHG